MFSSETYISLFKELNQVHSDPGPFEKVWVNVPLVKYHVLNDLKLSDEAETLKFARAYISEIANQFRDEELIVKIKVKGSGMFYQPGFSTDISESCAWLTPFIKPPSDLFDLR